MLELRQEKTVTRPTSTAPTGTEKVEHTKPKPDIQSESGSSTPRSDNRIVTDVTISVLDTLDNINIPPVDKDDIPTSLEALSTLWQQLNGFDFMLDAGRGYVNWLKGEILLRFKPLPEMGPEWSSKLLPHGTYGHFLKQHNVSASSGYWWRRIRRDIPRQDARRMGYDEMRAQFSPSYREALEKHNNTVPPNEDGEDLDPTEITGTEEQNQGTNKNPSKIVLLINLPQSAARLNEQLKKLKNEIEQSPVSAEPEKLSEEELLELERIALGQITVKLESASSLVGKLQAAIAERADRIAMRREELD